MRRPGPLRGAVAIASACLILAQPAAAQRMAGSRPTDTASDEAGIWLMSDKTEQQARASGELNTDPELNRYVRGVACKVATEYCADIRVYIMNRPFFNAAMAPNGYTEVWTGSMLRASNEAELAYILGHEIVHYTHSHSLESLRADKSRRNALLAVSIGIAVIGAGAAYNSGSYQGANSIMDATNGLIDALYLASIATFFSFSREQESAADKGGAERQAAVGYSPAAAGAIWRNLLAETQASDFERVRKSERRTNIFASHPLSKDRVAVLESYAVGKPAGDLGHDRYRAAIRPHLGAWIRDDLRRRDYGQSLHLIDRLAASGDDLGVLEFYRGEAYRLRSRDGDLDRARDAYLGSAGHDDAPVEVWRELGDIRVKQDDKAGARAAYEIYLAKAPAAEDEWLVRDALNSLK